jgi:hypothetical protein
MAEADQDFDASGEGSSYECSGLGGRLVDSVLVETTDTQTYGSCLLVI